MTNTKMCHSNNKENQLKQHKVSFDRSPIYVNHSTDSKVTSTEVMTKKYVYILDTENILDLNFMFWCLKCVCGSSNCTDVQYVCTLNLLSQDYFS